MRAAVCAVSAAHDRSREAPLTRGQHLQVAGQAAGVHALLPALLVKLAAKRDVALHCKEGGAAVGGPSIVEKPCVAAGASQARLLVDEQMQPTRACQAANVSLCELPSPVALMIQACCAAYARRPPTATRPLSRSISPSSA